MWITKSSPTVLPDESSFREESMGLSCSGEGQKWDKGGLFCSLWYLFINLQLQEKLHRETSTSDLSFLHVPCTERMAETHGIIEYHKLGGSHRGH